MPGRQVLLVNRDPGGGADSRRMFHADFRIGFPCEISFFYSTGKIPGKVYSSPKSFYSSYTVKSTSSSQRCVQVPCPVVRQLHWLLLQSQP